ncbi:hypothetical protein CC78DRAFT_483433, partial [Lojkania enalia]
LQSSKFVYSSNSSQFLIRGVSYTSEFVSGWADTVPQFIVTPAAIDYLSDDGLCRFDAVHFQNLKANTIFVSYIDPSTEHSTCMQDLADAGVYVLILLGAPMENYMPKRVIDSTFAHGVWAHDTYDIYTNIIDKMARFDNVLGFAVGDFYDSTDKTLDQLPFFKAAVRDVKAYIRERSYREIPVGVLRREINLAPSQVEGFEAPDPGEGVGFADWYLTCEDDAADFVGLSARTSLECATGDDIRETIGQHRIEGLPVFVNTMACNTDNYSAVDEVFGEDAPGYLSGGVVASFLDRFSNLVGIANATTELEEPDREIFPRFSALAKRFATVTTAKASPATPANATPASCPMSTPGNQSVSLDLPPRPYAKLCSCMMDTLSYVATETDDFVKTFPMPSIVANICEGERNCGGVMGNGSTGVYGAFSVCNKVEIWSWAATGYFGRHRNASNESALGQSVTFRKTLPQNNDPDCPFLLEQVGQDGTGTLTATAREQVVSTVAPTPIPTSAARNAPAASPTKGMTTGAKVGIGIGTVGIAVFLVLGGLLFLRQRRMQEKKHMDGEIDQNFGKVEMDASDEKAFARVVEAPAVIPQIDSSSEEIHEMPGEGRPGELGDAASHELDGGDEVMNWPLSSNIVKADGANSRPASHNLS